MANSAVHHGQRPAEPGGSADAARRLYAACTQARPGQRAAPVPPPGTAVSLPLYEAYRATGNYVSADGRTVQYSVGLQAGDAGSTAAMRAVPAVRAATTQVGKSIGAADSGVGG